ncbi:GNAT family N-acetyltransferase [Nitrospira sp. NS4]|uniref:bifunctional acetate--CoA ligase family protein/GNAT family N-acetyltransferase n=1 Tax=Nitrospira sp. NS4 TaxID=3414498 RepID=UPI003C2CBC3F
MKQIHPLFQPPPASGSPESGPVILRDGTTAAIRPTHAEDRAMMQAFINRLSPASRRHRFFSETGPPADTMASLCDSSNPAKQLTVAVTRTIAGQPRIIAAGSYWARTADEAEVAMAVADDFHGKGLGTILLERLAMLAIHRGFTRLWAVTHTDNVAMREVFRESGYPIHESYEGGDMQVQLSLHPSEHTATRLELRERIATTASLRPFFYPRSVAVIGASRDPKSIGYRIVEALAVNRFTGLIYPVNPKAATIAGLTAFSSVAAIPDVVDLAVIVVPRDSVLPVLTDCAGKGISSVIVISSGFAESGPDGKQAQDRLLEAVRQQGMRMIGPNCFGLLNADPAIRLNATFTSAFPPAGRMAMASQSGALGLAILAAAHRLQLGVSSFVSLGNNADVSTNDLLQYWEDDPSTDLILLYLESFGNPRRFARIARRVARRKPIVAIKSGRSLAGRRAASSHTAALASSEVAVDTLFQQSGVIRADTLDELFALARGLAEQPLPKGQRVGIITNAGGPAILCTDACEAGGLSVPELSKAITEALTAFLPPAASVKNPVDLIASAAPDHYTQAITTLLASGEVDALIVLYMSVTVGDAAGIASGILRGISTARQAGGIDIPIYICWMAEGDLERTFQAAGETIPTFPLPEHPAVVLGKARRYDAWRSKPLGMIPDFDDMDFATARAICATTLSHEGPGWLTVEDTRALLAAAKLPVAQGGVARTADRAVALAHEAGFPVAVKLASHQILHKTEIGGVHLNLADEQAVRNSFEAIRARLAQDDQLDAMEGVLVQPMLSGGTEVMVGVTHDPLFGPLIAFGLGGIHVEILGDVRFRITPLTDRDAAQLVREIKGYRLLQGYRGHPAADVAAIEEVLLRLSRLVEEIPEISELDLNPIFALPPGQGCRIVDARIRVVK